MQQLNSVTNTETFEMLRRILRACPEVSGETTGRRLMFFFSFRKSKSATNGSRFEAVAPIQQTLAEERKALREEAFPAAFDSLYGRGIC
jgi:hypothetical protein